MAKPHVTRTLASIHFEDLDPHRFEDLVRLLAYDFRQWRTLEPTGRGGADDGFDARAYEIVLRPPSDVEDTSDNVVHPMDGNMWMFQCKREKELGPKRIRNIISDAVKADSPPYGYVLAAPVHFSKAAHDAFRDELRARGVMEFDLWGAGELEDMLYQPKNDRILFAFFGISLTARRQSKITDVRSKVNFKNKLKEALGQNPSRNQVLLRDLNDEHYPYEGEYPDFDSNPRWQKYTVLSYHPMGLVVELGRYYAYVDEVKGEWDFAENNNFMPPSAGLYDEPHNSEERAKNLAAKSFWEKLPHAKKTILEVEGIIPFGHMAFVDKEGDSACECPHIYADYKATKKLILDLMPSLKKDQYHSVSVEDLKRVKVFPNKFEKPFFGANYADSPIDLDPKQLNYFKHSSVDLVFFDIQSQHKKLKPSDIISFVGIVDADRQKKLFKVTCIEKKSGKEAAKILRGQLGRYPTPTEEDVEKLEKIKTVNAIEVIHIHHWQIEQDRPVL